jgi:hypothetical protein
MSVHAHVPVAPAADMATEPAAEADRPEVEIKPQTSIYMSEPGPRQVGLRTTQSPTPQTTAERSDSGQAQVVGPASSRASLKGITLPLATKRSVLGPQSMLHEAAPSPIAPLVYAPLMNAIRERGSNFQPDGRRETTEVHVHIGRIELTALPDAPAPKKKPKPATSPARSLSDYLSGTRT